MFRALLVIAHFQLAVCALMSVDRSRLAAVVQAAQERGDIPGLALSIVNRSSVLFQGGFGVSNVSSGRRMNSDTLLPLGSTTKAFTSALLAMLMDKHATDGVKSVCILTLWFCHCFD